jgi:hypothetical protein
MAPVVIGGGDTSRHEAQAQQDRAQARQDSANARQRAAMGDYQGAARDQRAARDERHDAHRQERKADRDANGAFVQFSPSYSLHGRDSLAGMVQTSGIT